ncbi:unnamed protein product [Coffea canephora]|uniref:Uncharacterized protein n=1 Tax=Coffea canephora TaxID=49390 RepID=A0A068VD43_COFCA|nr:unnamed protein product [Coffea canephora]
MYFHIQLVKCTIHNKAQPLQLLPQGDKITHSLEQCSRRQALLKNSAQISTNLCRSYDQSSFIRKQMKVIQGPFSLFPPHTQGSLLLPAHPHSPQQ